MKIFGKTLSEYVSFEKGFLALILIVGLARLILSLAGVANSLDKFLSLTVLLLLGMIYYAVRVYTSGFGSYKQLYPIYLLQWFLSQCIIVSGIVIAILTGRGNIFSAPEYSPGKADGKTWLHAVSHLIVIVVLPLVMWAIGSLLMFVTKKVTGGGETKPGTARA